MKPDKGSDASEATSTCTAKRLKVAQATRERTEKSIKYSRIVGWRTRKALLFTCCAFGR